MPEKKQIVPGSGNKPLRNVALAGLVVNVLLSGIKLAAGFFGNSYALIADSVHSLSDCASDLAVLFGMKYWSRPADSSHPYGHRRIETVITVVIGLLLLGAGIRIGLGSIGRIAEGVETRPGILAAVTAFFSIILKEIMYRVALKAGKKHESKAMIANAHHHRADAISSLPVPVGVSAAYLFPTMVGFDAAAALIVSFFVGFAGIKILLLAYHELIDTSVSKKEREQLGKIAGSVEGVRGVHRLRARYHGAKIVLDLHITVDGEMKVSEGHAVSERVKDVIISKKPDVMDVIVHLEPCER